MGSNKCTPEVNDLRANSNPSILVHHAVDRNPKSRIGRSGRLHGKILTERINLPPGSAVAALTTVPVPVRRSASRSVGFINCSTIYTYFPRACLLYPRFLNNVRSPLIRFSFNKPDSVFSKVETLCSDAGYELFWKV